MPKPGLLGGAKIKLTAKEKRLAAITMSLAAPNMTSKEIAARMEEKFDIEMSPSAVRKWWKSNTIERKVGSGGHNRTPPAHVAEAVKLSTGFRRTRDGGWKRALSTRRCQSEMTRRGRPVSSPVLRRGLSADGLKFRRRSRASRLSQKNRDDRKELDGEEGGHGPSRWLPVFFTDSTPVHLQYGGNAWNDGTYLHPEDPNKPRTMNKHSKFVHVYGAVCGYVLFGPYYIEEGCSITGKRYVEQVLRPMIRDLKKFARERGVGFRFEFQQDNAGAHFAKVTTDFLDEEKVDYWPKGKWPGNSADLSPIENVWAMLKASIYENGEPKSMQGLKRLVSKFFRDFGEAVCRRLLEGMPRRFEQLREANFFVIKH